MTRAFVLASALVLTTQLGCGSATQPPKGPEASDAKKQINQALDEWHAAAARAEESSYFAHFDPGAVFLGTDATERWDLEGFRKFAHPYFSKGKAWTFKSTRRDVTIGPGGRIAWFDEDLETKNLGPARGSGVMLYGGTDATWRIAQYNLALTVPNEKVDAVKKLLGGE
jgi:hypothetical protein